MKKKNLLLAILFLAGVSFSSCSKEQDALQPKVSIEPKTEKLYVDLGAISAESDEARLAQKLENKGLVAGPFLTEKDLLVRLAVRRKGEPNAGVAVRDYRLNKVHGKNKYRYAGYIEIPVGTNPKIEVSGLVLSEVSNTATQDDGQAYLTPAKGDTRFMDFSLGDYSNPATSLEPGKLFRSVVGKPTTLDTRLPYMTEWVEASIGAGVGNVPHRVTNPLELEFKKSGTLLRLKFQNKQDKPIKVKSLVVVTNAIAQQATYDLRNYEHPTTLNNAAAASQIKTTAFIWDLKTPITVPAAQGGKDAVASELVYVWVAPTGGKDLQISPMDDQGRVYDNSFKTSNLRLKDGTMELAITLRPKRGSVPPTAGLTGNVLPLAHIPNTGYPGYFAMIVMADDSYAYYKPKRLSFNPYTGSSINYDPEVPGPTHYWLSGRPAPADVPKDKYKPYLEFRHDFDPVKLVDSGIEYRMMSYQELGAIFPGIDISAKLRFTLKYDNYNVTQAEYVKVDYYNPDEKPHYIGQYKGSTNGEKVIYGLRYIPNKQKGNNDETKITAFRYEYVNPTNIPKEGVPYVHPSEWTENMNIAHLKVTARYLGANNKETIETIASPDFWNRNTGNDVTLRLPALGSKHTHYNENFTPSNFGSSGHFWTNSLRYSSDSKLVYSFSSEYINVGPDDGGFNATLRANRGFNIIAIPKNI